MQIFKKLVWLSFTCSLFYAPVLLAQQDEAGQNPPGNKAVIEDVEFQDNLGRDTPRSSFAGFLHFTEAFDYAGAVDYIDLRNLPHAVRKIGSKELARQLDFVIKRGMQIELALLSPRPNGQVVDGLPEYRDELGHVETVDGEITLYLQQVPGADGHFIWKVSNASIALIPGLYEQLSYPDWVESMRKHVPQKASFLGVELFKWIILLGTALVSAPIFWVVGLGLSFIFSKPGSALHVPVRRLFTRPLVVFAVMFLTGLMLVELGVGATAQKIVQAKTLNTMVVVWIIFSLIDLVRAARKEKFLALGRADAHILGRPLANAVKLLILITATLIWLSNSGVNISTLLAGLGVGGIALALALQKPIEDLLGAISIYSQQPMQAGDLCKYGGILGRIEEVGLRTTRIRTLNNTLVSIPNSLIAHGAIENYSARKTILYHPELPLRYDTSRDQVQAVVAGIDQMARAHPDVVKDKVRIRFTAFSEHSLIIRARIYVNTTDFSVYLRVVEELNLEIMKIVQAAGAKFSQGASTVMLEYGNDPASQLPVPS